MAKELPYFKFEPQEWESGMIQLCSLQSKALFIEICCLYWNRLGDLPYAFALHKLCNGDANLLEELESNSVYEVKDTKIVIKFLDEQLSEFNDISEKRANAAKKRWKNTSVMQVHSKSNAIREEKRRENNIYKDFLFFNDEFKSVWNDYLEMRKKIKKPATEAAEKLALTKVERYSNNDVHLAKQIVNQSIENSWQGIFELKNKTNGNTGYRNW